jgi:hypothetical protein
MQFAETLQQQNAEIVHFLEQYCMSKMAPRYAVLVEGQWGSGKTWLIKEFCAALKAKYDRPSYYVSLYGVNSAEDIVEQLYAQMHPLLSSSTVRRSMSVVRLALKATFKVDINDHEKAEIKFAMPKEGKKEVDNQGAILVFDDLERCTLPMESIFGLLNQFVEHEDARLIILSNESRVKPSSAALPFATIKEKLVGRTLRVAPEIGHALRSFLNEADDMPGYRALNARTDTILQVFQRTGHQNLRQLRQAVQDFYTLWQSLVIHAPSIEQERAFQDRLVSDVVALSMECRAGTVTPADLLALNGAMTALDPEGVTDAIADIPAHERLALHGMLDGARCALLPFYYARFFENGFLSKAESAHALQTSPYRIDPVAPDWLRLWHWDRLPENEFRQLLNDVRSRFGKLEYARPGELFHVIGLLLFFGQLGVLEDMDPNDYPPVDTRIIDQAQGVINDLDAAGRIAALAATRDDGPEDDSSYWGLPYWRAGHPRFRDLRASYRLAQTRVSKEKLEHLAAGWMDELENDAAKWARRISPTGGEDAIFVDVPAFSFQINDRFAKLLLAADVGTLALVNRAFTDRYLLPGNPNLNLVPDQYKLGNLDQAIEANEHIETVDRSNTLARAFLKGYLMPTVRRSVDVLRDWERRARNR